MTIRSQCPNCPLSFLRPEHLVRHSFVHSGLKPHACEVCQRAFSRLDALQRHRKIHQRKVKSNSDQSDSDSTNILYESSTKLSTTIQSTEIENSNLDTLLLVAKSTGLLSSSPLVKRRPSVMSICNLLN
ncbi:hypothetical protein BC833DRAFT_595531 [Globomyces pollinis-pini]|nr:hypothetical protein BC833DRAFT_595531 [Globomyces pollinis-pini]